MYSKQPDTPFERQSAPDAVTLLLSVSHSDST